jgi:uncharacterized protein (UPF0147 family)
MLNYIPTLIALISYVTKYLPTVINVVKTVEEIAKNKTMTSLEKKQKALDLLDEVLNFTNLPEEKQKDIINFISGLIDMVVSVLNMKNFFNKAQH